MASSDTLAIRDVGNLFVYVCSWFRVAFVSLFVSALPLQTRDIKSFHWASHIVHTLGHFQSFLPNYVNYGGIILVINQLNAQIINPSN